MVRDEVERLRQALGSKRMTRSDSDIHLRTYDDVGLVVPGDDSWGRTNNEPGLSLVLSLTLSSQGRLAMFGEAADVVGSASCSNREPDEPDGLTCDRPLMSFTRVLLHPEVAVILVGR